MADGQDGLTRIDLTSSKAGLTSVRFSKWPISLLMFGTLLLLLLPILLGDPRSTVGASVRLVGDRWLVMRTEIRDQASPFDLRVGDEIVALDGTPPSVWLRANPTLEFDEAAIWTIRRDGEEKHLPSDPAVLARQIDEANLMLGVAVALWLVGTVVLRARSGDSLALRFWLLTATMAVILALSPSSDADVVWARVVNVLAFSILPAVSVAFFPHFSNMARIGGRLDRALLGVAAIGVAIGGAYLVAGFAYSPWYAPLRLMLLFQLAVSWSISLGVLVWAAWRAREPALRRQLRTVLIGASIGFLPLVLLVIIPEVLALGPVIRPQLAALGLFALPLAVAIAILRDRLLGVDVSPTRAMLHGAMTIALVSAYGAFVWWSALTSGSLVTERQPFLTLVFFAALSLTFMPVLDRVHRLVDQLVYRERYDVVRTLRALGNEISSPRPLGEVLTDVVTSLMRSLDLAGAAVVLEGPQGEPLLPATCGIYRDGQLLRRVGRGGLQSHIMRPGELWLPLVAKDETIGTLVLARRPGQQTLNDEDRHLAETLARETTLVVVNSLLSEQLAAQLNEVGLLRDQLLIVNDEERKRLASDLHDGVLQDVLAFIRQAKSARELIDAEAVAPAQLRERVQRLIELGEDVAYDLRSVCTELYPFELTMLGLPAALEALARRLSEAEAIEVVFELEAFPRHGRLTEEDEEALYRAAREALANIVRHANARHAWIGLSLDCDEVVLTIRDDGRGFRPPRTFAALLRRGHLGLATLHERIQRLGGQVTILSEPSVAGGTTIRIRLPARTITTTDDEPELVDQHSMMADS